MRVYGLVSLSLVLALVFTGEALACRYAVRDVGFVALNDRPFRVIIAVPLDTDDQTVASVEAQSEAALEYTQFKIEVGRAGEGTQFDDASALARNQLPAAVLIAPDDRRVVIGSGFLMDDIETVLSPLVRSPIRQGLSQELIGGFATVLLVEGSDPAANAHARESADSAIRRINANLKQFDRVLEVGPALRTLRMEARGQERWLLWALGISVEPSDQPELAILFGHGRRLGNVLQGDSLNEATLYKHLAIVVQDCECDLDRAWLYGKRFPIVWTDQDRKFAYDKLGFDPESALVRAEVSRILNRGPNGGATDAPDPFISGEEVGGLGLTVYDIEPANESGDAPQTQDPPSTVASNAQTQPAASTSQQAASSLGDASEGPPIVLIVLAVAGLVVLIGAAVVFKRSQGGAA